MLNIPIHNIGQHEVTAKRLNEQFKRNERKFPDSFRFQITKDEWDSLRSQSATLKIGQHRKYLPYVFTEHGALQAANVLNSEKADAMSVYPELFNRVFQK